MGEGSQPPGVRERVLVSNLRVESVLFASGVFEKVLERRAVQGREVDFLSGQVTGERELAARCPPLNSDLYVVTFVIEDGEGYRDVASALDALNEQVSIQLYMRWAVDGFSDDVAAAAAGEPEERGGQHCNAEGKSHEEFDS